MINVIFVCLGNICRSPMAEFVFKDMVKKRGLKEKFHITSAGMSEYEEGNPIYPKAKETLSMNNIECSGHRAKVLTLSDIKNSDFVLVMDSDNLFNVLRLTAGEYTERIFKLCSFCKDKRDVADPYYTRNFIRAYNDIVDGCESFLNYLSDRI